MNGKRMTNDGALCFKLSLTKIQRQYDMRYHQDNFQLRRSSENQYDHRIQNDFTNLLSGHYMLMSGLDSSFSGKRAYLHSQMFSSSSANCVLQFWYSSYHSSSDDNGELDVILKGNKNSVKVFLKLFFVVFYGGYAFIGISVV